MAENRFGKELRAPTSSTSRSNRFGKEITAQAKAVPISEREPHEVTRAERVAKEYEAMPWYSQALQATDDMARLFGSGAAYGSVEALSPEEAFRTDDARERAGIPGLGIEIGGMVASPITRAFGAVGRGLAPEGSGLLRKGLGLMAEGAGIGGTSAALSGRPEDIPKDAAMGAAMPLALTAAAKTVSVPIKHFAAQLSGADTGAYKAAFDTARKGGAESKAFAHGMSGAKDEPRFLGEAYEAAENAWSNPNVSYVPVYKTFTDIAKTFFTPDKVAKISDRELRKVSKIKDALNEVSKVPANVKNLDAFRHQLRQYTETAKLSKSVSGKLSTRLQNVIKDEIEKVQPGYKKQLEAYSKGKEAVKMGRKLSSYAPKFDRAAGNILAALAAGAASYLNPAALATIPAQMAMASPKLGGKTARGAGRTLGIFDALAGGKTNAALPMATYETYSNRGVDTPAIQDFLPGR